MIKRLLVLLLVGLSACSGAVTDEARSDKTLDAVAEEVAPDAVAIDPVELEPSTTDPLAIDSVVIDSVAVPIVSTGADQVRDLIRPGDSTAFACIVDLGPGPGEFYDKVNDVLVFPDDTHFFEARYSDGTVVEIRIHPDLVADADPATQANRIAKPIGLLPTELRAGIERVGFLGGDAAAQADGGGEGIHVYETNVALREVTNRFEETLFHESVHTSLDDAYATTASWADAQEADGTYLTEYASEEPDREDLAETALYAWALLHHPDRISDADAAAWAALVPNRMAFLEHILSPPPDGQPDADVGC